MKFTPPRSPAHLLSSPSMRREWIEITDIVTRTRAGESPSMRREWIEMVYVKEEFLHMKRSPSMRREWIEIQFCRKIVKNYQVSLHAEGVD